MLAKIMKWVSGVTLLLMAGFSDVAEIYTLLLSLLIFMGAIIVFQQAIEERSYLMATGFVAIALIFNPAAPLFRAWGSWFPLMALVCATVFTISLIALRTKPLLSIPSITDRTPGSESL